VTTIQHRALACRQYIARIFGFVPAVWVGLDYGHEPAGMAPVPSTGIRIFSPEA
jgi:hypothetical protein